MKLTLIIATVFFAASAMAAVESESKVIGRFDYDNTKTDTTTAGTTTEDSTGEYKVNYLRWKNAAKFNDTITGELTLDLSEAASGTAGNNILHDFIDTAFITKAFGPGFTATIGKQSVLIGGRENDWSTADLYLTSKFNQDISSNLIGLTLGYTVADQTLYIQHLENDTTNLTDKKATGIAWYGNILNNMINPIVSYHKYGTDRPGQYDIIMAAGLQFNIDMMVIEADYLTRTNEMAGTSTTGAVADAELKSMIAHVRYNHENFRPFIKFIKEDSENSYSLFATQTGVAAERTAYELGLEYVPNKDEAMRYHVVYNTSEAKNSTGVSDKSEVDTIFAGVKFDLTL